MVVDFDNASESEINRWYANDELTKDTGAGEWAGTFLRYCLNDNKALLMCHLEVTTPLFIRLLL